jgi:chromosome segregation ATPase
LVVFTLKVLIVLVVLGALGAALYLGGPLLIDEYLLKDVRVNSEQIQDVSAELEANAEFMEQRLSDLHNRIEALEIQNDTDQQVIDDLSIQLDEAQNTLQEQSAALEDLGDLRSSLDDVRAQLALFEDQINELDDNLGDFQTELRLLNQSALENQQALKELRDRQDAEDTVGTLRQELELLKVMELITRARVSIGQDNTGFAGDDLQSAQDILASLSQELPAFQAEYLSNIAQRLDLASNNLTGAPGLVDEDLEVAWQLLLQGLPETQEELGAAPTTAATDEVESPTPTPTAQP